MKPGARYPRNREHITKRANWIAAIAKANIAPLETLTDDMLDSITASHARRGTKDYDKLMAELKTIIGERVLRALS